MKNEFVSYEIALALKKLGFNEDCLYGYFAFNDLNQTLEDDIKPMLTQEDVDNYCRENKLYPFWACSAPLYQQAFAWFSEKYGYDVSIKRCSPKEYQFIIELNFQEDNDYHFIDFPFSSYKEAELECIRKIIKIIEK
jgi:hypothetical protein